MSKGLKLALVLGGIVLVFIIFAVFRSMSSGPKLPPVTLEFWNVFDTSEQMQPLLTALKQKYNYQINYRSFTDVEEYRDTLLTELAAGQGPDIFALHYSWLPQFDKIAAPLPATDLGYGADQVRSDFVDAVSAGVLVHRTAAKRPRTEAESKDRDEVLALPLYVDSLALFYNSSIFKNVLAKPSGRPEQTWSGIQAEVAELTARDEATGQIRLAGLAAGRADNISRGVDLFYALYRQFGGQGFLNARGKPQAATERATAADGKSYNPTESALELLTRFSREKFPEYSWSASMGQAPEQELDDFARGKVAMVTGYSYYPKSIEKLRTQYQTKRISGLLQAADLGVAPLPQIFSPSANYPRTALAEYFALGVPRASQQGHAAWQAILYLTSPTAQQQYFAATGKVSGRRDMLAQQQQDKQAKVFAEQAVYAGVLPVADDAKYREVFSEVIDSVADGELKVSEALRQIDRSL